MSAFQRKTLLGLTVILLAIGSFMLYHYHQYTQQTETLERGLAMISEGNTEEGLRMCDESGIPGICYANLLRMKIAKDEQVPPEFCESIPLESDPGFFFSREWKETYDRQIAKVYAQCMAETVFHIIAS